ncbi:GMC family oxidoreductase N-terminal domain-containing protein [Sagittula sp. NFXS13]|uniref:GMC family oxidoreductase n=1 Tax=Sagittula sp. NFXS13 TaxID=2819095 RepID=UPI0032DE7352
MSEHDVIIVGGGSAGATLAGLLSEDESCRVLLLEGGRRDVSPWIHIPATFFKIMQKGRDAVMITGEPEDNLAGRPFVVPQGNVLGGGSSVNAMLYLRGQPQDYDDWAANGAEGWSWADVGPVFKRLENNDTFDDDHHGSCGPLAVSSPRHRHPLSEAFVNAGMQAQIRPNRDFNGARQEGIGFFQTTTHKGRRASAARAFLWPVRQRKNLTVMTNARVDRVLISQGRATGVRLADGREVHASREVVLSAGAFATPLILMRSGIGPRADLEAQGIPVVADLPGVGQNFQDHAIVPIEVKTREPLSVVGEDRMPRGALHMLQYLATRRGLLSSNMVEAGGFIDVAGGGRPDVQLHFMPGYNAAKGVVQLEGHGVVFSVCVLRPKSRGEVRLRSADPADPPVFRSGVMSDPADMALSIAALRKALGLLEQPALQAVMAERKRPAPGPDTDETLTEYIRSHAKTVYHPAGTSKMGSASNPMAVVDQRLAVHGIKGLRVADASVMPCLPSGNTNAPTIMIGARAADFIRASA